MTDNWHASPDLACMLTTVHTMTMIGAHTLQKGKGGKAPFKKPSNSTVGSVPRGWSRRAVAKMADPFTCLLLHPNGDLEGQESALVPLHLPHRAGGDHDHALVQSGTCTEIISAPCVGQWVSRNPQSTCPLPFRAVGS